MRFIKYQNIILFILGLTFLFAQKGQSGIDLSMLQDKDFARYTITNGRVGLLSQARQETELGNDARLALIKHATENFVACPLSEAKQQAKFLVGLIKTYPDSNNETLKGLTNSVFETCRQDTLKYLELFLAIFPPTISQEVLWASGISQTPRENFLEMCSNSLSVYHRYLFFERFFSQNPFPTTCGLQFHALFLPKEVFEDSPVLPFAIKILSVDPKDMTVRQKQENPDLAKASTFLQYFAPLYQGDAVLLNRGNPHIAAACYERSKFPVGKDYQNVHDYRSRRIAITQCCRYYSDDFSMQDTPFNDYDKFFLHLTTATRSTMPSEREGAFFLEALWKLGFLEKGPNKTQEEIKQGLNNLKKLMNSALFDYAALAILTDHYLGRAHLTVQDIGKALDMIKEGLSEKVTTTDELVAQPIRNLFLTREGEIYLGLYNDSFPKDLPRAIECFKQANCPETLHRIYMSTCGALPSPEEAQTLVEKNQHLPYFQVIKGQQLIAEGKYDQAFRLLEKINFLGARYLTARLFLSPLSGHYDESQGLKIMKKLAKIDYRDSRHIYLSRFVSQQDPSLSRNLKTQTINELLNITPWSAESVSAQFQTIYGSVTSIKSEASAADDLSRQQSGETAACAASLEQISGFEEESFPDEIDPEELNILEDSQRPLTVLEPEIEEFMNQLGSQWTLNRLLTHTGFKRMGGEHVPGTKQIKFPGIEKVFNFHMPHQSKPQFCLKNGYWRHLNRLIQMRYAHMVQKKVPLG